MDNDSYPPSADWENNNARDISNLNQLDVSSENECISSDSTNDEESDEGRGRITSDNVGSDVESSDVTDDYNEPTTGIKVKYNLKLSEIKDFIRRGRKYEKNFKVQKKHTIIQSVLFVLLVVVACLGGSFYYMALSVLPLIALTIMWIIPFINIRVTAKKLIKEDEFTVEIFPDRLEIESNSGQSTLFLDNMCQSEEYKNSIIIFKHDGSGLIIPLRAIDPEDRADVQAMIVAGSSPLSEGYEA